MRWVQGCGIEYWNPEIERSNVCICDVSRDISGSEHGRATPGNLVLSNFKLNRKNAVAVSGDFRRRETAGNGKESARGRAARRR